MKITNYKQPTEEQHNEMKRIIERDRTHSFDTEIATDLSLDIAIFLEQLRTYFEPHQIFDYTDLQNVMS